MIRWMFILCLLPAAVFLAAEEKTVKPSSVETKKEADTQIFVSTEPEGAKVIADGKNVGSAPHLFVVPKGARKMTIVVELDGYEKGQRTVEVRGGKVMRVIFDLKKDDAAGVPSTGEGGRAGGLGEPRGTGTSWGSKAAGGLGALAGQEAPPAPPVDIQALARQFGEALAAADREVLDRFWKLDDPLDREAADLVTAVVKKATQVLGRPPEVDLVHCARTGKEYFMACYYGEGMPLFDADNGAPIFQSFHLEDGRWRTEPFPNLRMMVTARMRGAEDLGRRILVQRLIDLRFGTVSPEERIAAMREMGKAQEKLARPPYNLSHFEHAGEAIRKHLEEYREMQKLPWPEVKKRVLSMEGNMADVGSPSDFYLVFYLEAAEGEDGRRIPGAGGEESYLVEPIPCLTDEEVERAEVINSPDGEHFSVSLELTEFGTRVFGQVTKENIGRRVAIVVGGKVLSAPKIRSEIAGGRAMITGNFTHAEAEKMADELNAKREQIRELLDSMREELEAWKKGA